jgi:hypothetical protein
VAEPPLDLTFTVCLEDAGEFDVQHDHILARVYAETRHVSPITTAFEHKKKPRDRSESPHSSGLR